MVNTACDPYPGKLMDEIQQAYGKGLVNPGDVDYEDVKRTLAKGQEKRLEDTLRNRKGLIGNVINVIAWWACFWDTNSGGLFGQGILCSGG